MKLIQLGKSGKFAQVDDDDFEYINQSKWYIQRDKNNYYAFGNDWCNLSMHRVIMGCAKGDGKIVDHMDGDGLNNQKSNLRFCSRAENKQNSTKRKSSNSIYKGVFLNRRDYFSKKNKRFVSYFCWRAKIKIDGKDKHLGNFRNEIEAAIAYNDAAQEYFGEFACLNIIQ